VINTYVPKASITFATSLIQQHVNRRGNAVLSKCENCAKMHLKKKVLLE
jgi:hypothetical protein